MTNARILLTSILFIQILLAQNGAGNQNGFEFGDAMYREGGSGLWQIEQSIGL